MYIERHATRTLERLCAGFPAILVTGARQTGKTTLLRRLTRDRGIAFLTFDDPVEEMSAKTDPKAFLALHPSPMVFDEIQYVPELFRYLKIAIDGDRRPGMYFLTGSQQFHLMQEASESLAGRIGILQLAPLSAREIRGDAFAEPFVPTRQYVLERAKSLSGALPAPQALWERIWQGGYPEIVSGHLGAGDFFGSYLKTYIERDIRQLARISDEMQFLQFITVVAARTAQLVNYQSIANECGISAVTARKWLSLLVTSGLVYLLPPYHANVEKRMVKTPKLYFMDTGLASFLTRWTNPEVLRNGAMAGAMFETFVVTEIIKSFANRGETPPLSFYRDKDQIEIDLLIERDGALHPVEIKKTATPGSRDAKNFSVLERIGGIATDDPVIVCCADAPAAVARGRVRALAIPAGFL